MVCPCSGAYMRGENGKESLMVCLSEYQIEIEKSKNELFEMS